MTHTYGGPDGDQWGEKEWGSLKLVELRQALVERELATSGNKASFVKRLLEWCDGELVGHDKWGDYRWSDI